MPEIVIVIDGVTEPVNVAQLDCAGDCEMSDDGDTLTLMLPDSVLEPQKDAVDE